MNRFEPPCWGDVCRRKGELGWIFSFQSKDGRCDFCELISDYKKDKKYYMQKCFFLYLPNGDSINLGLTIKENYINAIEISRRIFLGENL